MFKENDVDLNLRTIDLFCGAGGLSKGFEQADFNVLAGVDQEEEYLNTFKKNHNAIAVKTNLKGKSPKEFFTENNIDPKGISVVIGGPPCKGFSLAGHRDPDDERNNLVDVFVDFVEYIKPDMFLMENVVGILSMEDGKIVDIIMKRFQKAGYENARWKVLNAANYGVPQRRKRVIFLGRSDGKEPNYPKKTHRVKKEINLLNNKLKPPAKVLDTLLDKDFSNLPNHDKTSHSKEMVERIKEVDQGSTLYDNYNDSWKRLEPDKPSITIKENHNAPFIHPIENRVGTVRECAVLQSFPDDFVFKGSKSKQLKQVGNAVPPLLAKKIALRMKKDLREMNLGKQ